jgi:hypothetical protein
MKQSDKDAATLLHAADLSCIRNDHKALSAELRAIAHRMQGRIDTPIRWKSENSRRPYNTIELMRVDGQTVTVVRKRGGNDFR